MALSDPYATLAELKLYSNNAQTTYDDILDDALTAASQAIESVCHRQFNDAGSVSPRVFRPVHSTLVEVDDFSTSTGLIVKTSTNGDGVFDTTWAAGEYEPRPLNGIVSGQPGWPFCNLWSDGTRLFPTTRFASVEVTAQWGWTAVPKPIKQACLMIAHELFKMKDAPFGVAGATDYGTVTVRENKMVMKRLAPYILDPILTGF